MKKIIILLLLAFAPAYIFSQSITNGAATNVSYETATINASGTSLDPIVEYLVEFRYSTNATVPTGSTIVMSPSFTGGTSTTFSYNLTGLSNTTTYYYKARLRYYDVVDDDWYTIGSFTGILNFTTLSPAIPSVSIGTDFSSITNNSATNTANDATSSNGSNITDKGLVYGTSTNPTIANSSFSTGTSGTGTFNGSLTSLNELTKYYVRAYALNGIGYGYSATEKTFKTLATNDAAIISLVSPASGQLTITYDNGSGDGCIICVKEEGAVDADPVDGTTYTGNTAFGSGDQIGTGNYVVYYGTAAKGSILVTGLNDTKTYYFRIAAYGGVSPIYDINLDQPNSADDSNLPVELIDFTASQADNGILLNWTTASEVNNHYFAIEKSFDAINYEELTTIDGAGNSNIMLNYSFVDQNTNTDRIYYRLRQVDFDGQITYSQIITINSTTAKPELKYLNSDAAGINIIFTTTSINSTLILRDVNGKAVKTILINSSGNHQMRLSTIDLSRGVYFITLQDSQNRETKKVIL